MDLKITTLADNLSMTHCLGQWGLSLLLEFVDAKGHGRKVVFDTGIHKESLQYNIKELKVDMSDVDCVVISHGHHDHTSATVEVVKTGERVKVYAHPHAFLPRFYEDKTGKRRHHGIPKGEGLKEIEKAGGEAILTIDSTEIVPGIWTTGQIERATQFERVLPVSKEEKRIIVVDGEEINDQILDDQALFLKAKGLGSLVITGCAHAGLMNTLLQVQKIGGFEHIHGLIGGTHLVGRSDEYLQKTIDGLRRFDLSLISPCHCTGFKAMARLWQAFPDKFVLNFCGKIIEVEKEQKTRVI